MSSQIFAHHTNYHDAVDNIYYNVELTNPENADSEILMKYEETKNQPIINGKASDYYFSVVRFDIPSNNIPIFNAQNMQNPNTFTLDYVVTLTYLGVDYQANLIYIPLDVNVTTDGDLPIYTYQQFLDLINTAYQTAYNAMIAANGGVGGALDLALQAQPPIFTFERTDQLLSIFVQDQYNVEGVDIFMNWELYQFFRPTEIEFIGYQTVDEKDVRLIVKDNFTNRFVEPVTSISYFRMGPQQVNLYLWYDLRKIVIISNNLPVQREFISTNNQDGSSNNLAIITDFAPQIALNPSESLSRFEFFPTGPYRLQDLNSNMDIRKIDFQIYYLDKYDVLRPMFLEPGENLNLKFLFTRKDSLSW